MDLDLPDTENDATRPLGRERHSYELGMYLQANTKQPATTMQERKKKCKKRKTNAPPPSPPFPPGKACVTGVIRK
jgi:hypothetical protein